MYQELLQNELLVLEKTDHPNITRIFQILEDKRSYWVVMELIEGGNLLDKIISCNKFNEDHACFIIHQIMLALNYMHLQHVMHRDLKLENIMCRSTDLDDFNVKLTDFGFSTFFQPEIKQSLALGSPLYMAPELHRQEKYDERVDVWSLGCIAYIMMSGAPPFAGNDSDMHEVIESHQVSFEREVWGHISEDAKDFIKMCLNKDQEKRCQIKDLFATPWI